MPASDSFSKLTDSNYADWRYQMEAFPTTKDLWDIVDGIEVRPAGSDNIKVVKIWQKKQRLA